MAGRVRTWIWVVVAIAVVITLGLVTIAGVGFYFVSRHIETRGATGADAAQEFERVRARFAGQTPLVELDRDGQFVRAHTDRVERDSTGSPDALHLMAFDPSDGRLVRFHLPFWLLRLRAGNTTIDLNGNRMSLEDLRLRVEDLERYGSALVVDHQSPDGERVLVWSE